MNEVSERIARIIENDANGVIKRTMRVVQSDVMALLCEFMDVSTLDMSVEGGDGCYDLTVTAKVARIYDIGKTSDVG